MKVRIVIDTNVLISALFWHGAPRNLLKHARNNDFELMLSQGMLEELAKTIIKSKFSTILERAGIQSEQILNDLRAFAEIINAPSLSEPVCRDPDDDMVLACAIAADANIIVTGDKDLLVLHPWGNIEILNPADMLQRLSIDN